MPGSLSIQSACEESGFLIGPGSPGRGLPRGKIMGCFFPVLQPTTSRLTSCSPLNTTAHRNTMIALISKLAFSVSGTQPELLGGCRERSVAASSPVVLSSSLRDSLAQLAPAASAGNTGSQNPGAVLTQRRARGRAKGRR